MRDTFTYPTELKIIVGEVCAAAIAIVLIVYDGELGLMAAIAIGGFLAGMNIDLNALKSK